MALHSDRRWASGAGTLAPDSTTASPAAPRTGTPPGAWRGRGDRERFGQTERRDGWWVAPLVQALGLGLLGLYATWAALQGAHYEVRAGGRDYLSPFYSPLMLYKWWPLSPALLILWAP